MKKVYPASKELFVNIAGKSAIHSRRGLAALLFGLCCMFQLGSSHAAVTYEFIPSGSFNAGQENFAASITVSNADVAAGSALAVNADLLLTLNAIASGIGPIPITITEADLNPAASDHSITFSADRQTISAFAQVSPGNPGLTDAWLLTQSFNYDSMTDVDHVAILRAGGLSLESLISQPGSTLLLTNSVVAGEWRRVPEIPLPAAAWLFASGLLGLVAAARRRSGNV